MTEDGPTIAQKSPCGVDLEAGQVKFWCVCGRSQSQPYCDGSHKGTDFTPLRVEIDKTGRYFLCACKHTGNPPFCDGTHNKLG